MLIEQFYGIVEDYSFAKNLERVFDIFFKKRSFLRNGNINFSGKN